MALPLGQYHYLKVNRFTDFGVYLDTGDRDEVLLPQKYVPIGTAPGESINVFVYLDHKDRPVATTQMPLATVGDFAYLKVIDQSPVGTFVDWGLDKDLLVPFAEQQRDMVVGKKYLLYIYVNQADGRIVGSTKIDKFIVEEEDPPYEPKQPVEILIANRTDLGYKAIIDQKYVGLLYDNEIYEDLHTGQTRRAYIKRIRPDGKIDLNLQGGQETRDKKSQEILFYLKAHDGFAPVHDKSDPKLIADTFGMSKKEFKRCIGGLYKEKAITIASDGIRLAKGPVGLS